MMFLAPFIQLFAVNGSGRAVQRIDNAFVIPPHSISQQHQTRHGCAAAVSCRLAARQPKHLTQDEVDASVCPLMQLAQAHFSAQALNAIVQMGVPDIIGDDMKSIDEIASEIEQEGCPPNKQALLRTMRLLCSVGVFYMSTDEMNGEIVFGLTPTGALLQTGVSNEDQPSLAHFVRHWTEPSQWNAWLELPDFVAGRIKDSPFERANGVNGIDFFQQNSQSAVYRNAVAGYISSSEIPAVLDGFDWSSLSKKTVVDIGGGYGSVMAAVAQRFPDIKCICLDLPHVIEDATFIPDGVELVGGDMFKPETIPRCNAIFTKHVLCDWNDEDVAMALASFHSVLTENGKVIIADAVLLDGEEANNTWQIQVFIDALLMLFGNKPERSKSQWTKLAENAGFKLDSVVPTASLSCNITVLSKA